MPLTRTTLLTALLLFLHSTAAATTYYVNASTGNDSYTCGQAQTKTTPTRSINRGIACLAPGDTLLLADGTYDELVLSQTSSSRECSSGDAATQPGCSPLPNGLSPEQPTRLIGSGQTILSPAGRQWPGGGSAISIYDYARHLHVENLRIVKHAAAGSVGGIYIGNAQHITLTGNELEDGSIKGGVTSRYLTVTGNHIHHVTPDCVPEGQKPTPSACPHAAYICGTDHAFTDNLLEYGGYYGAQFSCEQGGLARIRIERNIVRYFAGVGLRCAAEDCLVASNLLISNGQGITLTGTGTVAHNTIAGYQDAPWNEDPTAIWTTWGDGSGFTIVDNLITGFPNSFLAIGNAEHAPANPSLVHHNLCDQAGNPGCMLSGTAAQVYTNAEQGDYTLRRSRDNPALGTGVPVANVSTDLRGRPYHTTTPSVGAYALDIPRPVPPEPPTPGALILACEGTVEAVPGKVTLTCTQQIGGRR